MDLALESSVSANVMRRRGVSNDLRDRGDEWPLLKVVKGLSVVVATVVDEVSMVFAALRHRCGWPYFLWCSIAAGMAWPRLKLSRWLRGAADVSDRCAIARLRSSTAVQLAWPNLAWLASVLPVASPTRANNLCARSPIPHEAGKTGGCFFPGPRCRWLILLLGLNQAVEKPREAPRRRSERSI